MAENPSQDNTYLFDTESVAEMGRLINQDQMVTKAMGGVSAGIEDISIFQNVLDLACGPGGWVLDMAFTYPDITVSGVDVSRIMIEYAKARARSQNLPNASFRIMDVTLPFDFADASFDLVNARFLFSVLKRDAWQPFLMECTRILRPGGTLRLTEPLGPGETSSPAFNQLASLMLDFLRHAGYGFSASGRTFGMGPALSHLLHQAGYENLRQFASVQNYSVYTPNWSEFYRNNEIAYLQAFPLFVNMGLVTQEEGERVYQQMLIELRADDFASMAYMISVLGTRPAA